MTRNQLQYWANKEIERSNRAKEAETQRSNLATEAINAEYNQARTRQADYANELDRWYKEQQVKLGALQNLNSALTGGLRSLSPGRYLGSII